MLLKRKHYKFTDKKTSKRGIASVVLFLGAMGMVGYGIYLSFLAHGQGDVRVGLMGTGGLILASVGVFFGLNSLKDENVFHTSSWIGSVGNAVIWIFVLLMIMIGF